MVIPTLAIRSGNYVATSFFLLIAALRCRC
jgi:hypothetical protein